MGTNIDLLREGLMNYSQALSEQNRQLSDEFRNLQSCWAALREAYEGRGAEEFAESWARSADWFENYFEEIVRMSGFVEERAENLRNL